MFIRFWLMIIFGVCFPVCTNNAVAIAQTVEDKNPTIVLLGRARSLVSAGHRAEAEKIYKEAAAIAPQDHDLALEHAANLVGLGDTVNAVLEYRRAFEISPDNRRALDSYLRQISRLGAEPVAVKQLIKALSKSPNDLSSRLLLAELLRHDARYGEAIEQFSLSQRINPDHEIALSSTAESWLALGYTARAQQIALRLAKRKRGSDEAAFNLGWQARIYLTSGRPEAALRILRADLTATQKEPFTLGVLADTYRALGRGEDEFAALEKLRAVSSLEEQVSVLGRIARVLFELQDKTAAQAACEQLLEIDPLNAVGTLGLKLLGVSPMMLASVQLKSNSPARQAGLDREAGEAAIFWHQPKLAVSSFKRALKTRPDSIGLQLELGDALLQLNESDEAARVFASANISEGQRPDALMGWARAEQQRGNQKKVLEIYSDVLALVPSHFPAMLGRAETLMLLGDSEQAALLFAKLVEIVPESVLVNEKLRNILTTVGHPYRRVPQPASESLINGTPNRNNQYLTSEKIEVLLQPGDRVRVSLSGRLTNTAEAFVSKEGLLRLPFLKEEIVARCLTGQELRSAILKRVGSKTVGTTIDISFTKLQRAPLIIAGAVYLPDGYYVRTSLDLREGLMLASGANSQAGSIVYVLRDAASGEGKCAPAKAVISNSDNIEIYRRADVESGKIKQARRLRPGDALFVPEQNSAFIIGAIAKPGIIAARGYLTLRQAVKTLGGVLAEANKNHVRLLRLLPDGQSYQQFNLNFAEIESRRVGDVIVQPGDIFEFETIQNSQTIQGKTISFDAFLKDLVRQAQSPITDEMPQVIVTSKSH